MFTFLAIYTTVAIVILIGTALGVAIALGGRPPAARDTASLPPASERRSGEAHAGAVLDEREWNHRRAA